MNTFDLDASRNLPQGTIKRVSDGEREYFDIEDKRVPLRLTKRKLRLALIQRGIMPAQIEAIIDSLPSPQKEIAQVEWETADFYERTHPLIGQIGAALELSETDIDDVFVEGESI